MHYLTIELEQSDYDTDLMFVTLYRNWTFNKREYVAEFTKFTAPKYQALAIKNALIEADPTDYPKNNILTLVPAI